MRRRLLAIAAAARGATAAGGMRVEYKKPLPSAKCVVRPDQEQESQASEGTQAGMNEQYWPATVQQCLVFIGIARGSFGQCPAEGIFIGLAAIRVSRRVIVANSQPRQDGAPAKMRPWPHTPNGLDAGQRGWCGRMINL
jgi:hypothetical protein